MINTPPKLFKRNDLGLIDDQNIKYIFNDDGTINWRKMIKPEYLVANKQSFERYGKTVPKSIEGLEDKDLLILLGGIKELAQMRGYTSIKHSPVCPTSDYVVNVCTIEWIPNYETENRAVCYSAIGDASPFNTTGFTKNYLGPIAENRAFVRAVRNFLKINIVSQEEIGGNAQPEQDSGDIASVQLKEAMAQAGIAFDKIKDKLVKESFENAVSFTKVEDIPKFKQFELLERIKKAVKK